MSRVPRDVVDRIADKFTVGDGCWVWTSAPTGGYGTIRDNNQVCRKAYALIYEILVGPIPEGMELDHLCRDTRCVRPDHLEPVTHLENVRRGRAGHVNAAKTHCPRGHLYDKTVNNQRLCSACKLLLSNESRRRRKRAKAGAVP